MALLLCVWWLFLLLGTRFESTRLSSSFGWLHFSGGRSRLFYHPVTQQKQLPEMFFLPCALCGKGLRMGLGWAFAVNTTLITAL